MRHFSLRDLFWLTLVVALAVEAYVSRTASIESRLEEKVARQDAALLREELKKAKRINDIQADMLNPAGIANYSWPEKPVDWNLLLEPARGRTRQK